MKNQLDNDLTAMLTTPPILWEFLLPKFGDF